jgi:hypothetical protein
LSYIIHLFVSSSIHWLLLKLVFCNLAWHFIHFHIIGFNYWRVKNFLRSYIALFFCISCILYLLEWISLQLLCESFFNEGQFPVLCR